ncbi:MAG TPA: DUF192 domain-containing protein, partial [archaeon]|nr:DUF192 domain-containing protein [archaeon]
FFFLSGCISNESTSRVCFENNECFFVETASSPEKQAKGLMFVDSMNENQGMFFIFEEESERFFWMKNVLIPLDFVWIDEGFKVIDLTANVPVCLRDPCPAYSPKEKAKYVLELNSGTIKEKNLSVGGKVIFIKGKDDSIS